MPLLLGKQIRDDVRGRLACYSADWTDSFAAGSYLLAPTVYVFLASVLPALAFGQQLDDLTTHQIGIPQVLIVTAMAGIAQSFLGGQPLLIIGVAEPIVVMYGFMYELVKGDSELGVELFLPFCSWVCMWAGLLCVLLALFGATRLITYFTLFAGELFGGLIAVLFMQQAVHGTVEEFHKTGRGTINGLWAVLTVTGIPATIFYFQRLKHTRLLTPTLRAAADYAPVLMVVAWSGLSAALPANGLEGLPQRVAAVQPWEESTWSVASRMGDVPMKGVFLAIGPAVAISVLFFFDHTVSSQLAQTGDDVKVERPSAYAWDLLLLGVLTVLAGLLGLPPINGVIPQAPMHARALRGIKQQQQRAKQMQEASAAGVSPEAAANSFAELDLNHDGVIDNAEWAARGAMDLEVMEQRGSNLIQAVMVAICAFCAPAIRQIPTSVLWGYFAFMSLESVPDMQLSNRIILLFMEPSARKEHVTGKPYAEVQHSTIMGFTLLQVSLLAAIWALIVFGGIGGIAFPIPILLLLPLRSRCLSHWFGADNMRLLDEAVYEASPYETSGTSASVVPVPAQDTLPDTAAAEGCDTSTPVVLLSDVEDLQSQNLEGPSTGTSAL